MIILIEKKHLTKPNTLCKNIQRIRNIREFPQPDKEHLQKPTAIILNVKD